jgi:hypothetical protein
MCIVNVQHKENIYSVLLYNSNALLSYEDGYILCMVIYDDINIYYTYSYFNPLQ